MAILTIKNTYDIQLDGKPSDYVTTLSSYTQLAVLPSSIPYFKPKLLLKEGASVKIGTPLFCDKRHPDIRFLSPGCGTISKINYGPKRIIESVVIDLSAAETSESFTSFTLSKIESLSRNDIVSAVTSGGLWGIFNCRRHLNYGFFDCLCDFIWTHASTIGTG